MLSGGVQCAARVSSDRVLIVEARIVSSDESRAVEHRETWYIDMRLP